MNTSSETPASKGKMMVAAYRAARLSQRPVLRTTLQHSHAARRLARTGSQQIAEPDHQPPSVASATAPMTPVVLKTLDPASIFANLVNIADAEHKSDAAPSARVQPEPEPLPIPDSQDEPQNADEPAVSLSAAITFAATADDLEPAAPVVTSAYDPPLAEIGFGPGMLIRLSQLGLHTITDLAQANAEQLRLELGDISRLVDVEAWIRNARQTACTAST